MVVISLVSSALIGVTQERTARPSISTVQAPHCDSPQPILGAVEFEIVAQHVEQRRVRLGCHRARHAR